MIKTEGNPGKSLKELNTHTLAISLDMTEGCSLRCKYCFQDLGLGKKLENRKLTEDVMRQAVDWLFDDNTSGSVEYVNSQGGLSIEPWGGEPMHNFDMIVKTYEYALQKSKQTGKKLKSMGGTTNAVEFTEERLKWCSERNINWLVSLDGIKENHDKFRVTPTGAGSFDIVDRNIDLYKKVYGHQPEVRMSLHPDYIDNIIKSYEYIIGKGVSRYFFSPVFEADWNEESYRKLYENLVELYRLIIVNYKQGYPYVQNKFIDDMIGYILSAKAQNVDLDIIEKTGEYHPELNKLSRSMPLPKPCSQGSMYFGVSVDGQIYICHRFNKHGIEPEELPYSDRYGWLGNVVEGIHNVDRVKQLINFNVNDLDHCKYCKLKYYCKGGCYASNYDNKGELDAQNDVACRINLVLYNQANKILELFKENGMFDERRLQIVIPAQQAQGFRGVNGQIFDRCICNSGSYYIGVDELPDDDDESARAKLARIQGGLQTLLSMYFNVEEELVREIRSEENKNQYNTFTVDEEDAK